MHKGGVVREAVGTFPGTDTLEARKRARRALSGIEDVVKPHDVERAAKGAGATPDEVLTD